MREYFFKWVTFILSQAVFVFLSRSKHLVGSSFNAHKLNTQVAALLIIRFVHIYLVSDQCKINAYFIIYSPKKSLLDNNHPAP